MQFQQLLTMHQPAERERERETARFASFSNQAYPVDHALYATLFQSLMPHIGNMMMITDRFTNQFTDTAAA